MAAQDKAQQPQRDRCVLTRHDVQSIKDLVFIVGRNSESSAQKAIFEILANNMRSSRSHTPAPSGCLCDACTQTVQQCRERSQHIQASEGCLRQSTTAAQEHP
jgi:hypothetical protein